MESGSVAILRRRDENHAEDTCIDSNTLAEVSMGLPDSSQPITIVIVGVMVAIRWLEAHVKENNRQEAPTKEQLQELDCLKDLDLFETMCKILNISIEVRKNGPEDD